MRLEASEVFDFSHLDDAREEIEAINLKHSGIPYYHVETCLTYSDYNVRQGAHGRRVLSTLEYLLERAESRGRYLDVGSMDSPQLKFLARTFDEVTLVEPGPLYRDILGVMIQHGGLSNVTVVPSIVQADGPFDVVSAWECLEHVVNIRSFEPADSVETYWGAKRAFIGEIHDRLRPGGQFFWSVPVMTGAIFAAKYLAALVLRRRFYSAIRPREAWLHVSGRVQKISGPMVQATHRGFDERRLAQMIDSTFETVESRRFPGRWGLKEILVGHSRRSGG